MTPKKSTELVEKEQEILRLQLKEKTEELRWANKLLREQIVLNRQREKRIQVLNDQLRQYTGELHDRVRRFEAKKIPLTVKERRTLYGLVRHPSINGTMLARLLGLKPGTVNLIRTRLLQEGYYRHVCIPNIEALGHKFIHLTYSVQREENNTLKPAVLRHFKMIFKNLHERTFFIGTGLDSLAITITRSWLDFKQLQDMLEIELRRYGLDFETYRILHFPLRGSEMPNFFNYANITAKALGLDVERHEMPFRHFDGGRLTKNEAKVLLSLLERPLQNISELSKRTGLSSPTVCKLRSALMKKNALIHLNIPDFAKLGLGMFVFNHWYCEPGKSEVSFDEDDFFSVRGNVEQASFSVYPDYGAAKEALQSRMSRIKLKQKPFTLFMPLQGIRYQKFDFTTLARDSINRLDF